MKTYAVIGLGYVGLGLAAALSKSNKVFGYDINEIRLDELRKHNDKNNEIDNQILNEAPIFFTSKIEDLRQANFYIVTVSTPAYFYETPNLEPLINATKVLATVIKVGDIVVYESTVYPGTTEEICIPVLEEYSHLKCGKDFNVGYSPERINPADTKHNLKNVTKVIAAQNEKTLQAIKETYGSICDHIYPVSSIKIAEATKVLENTQRDINIAMMNEFSKIMHALDLNVHEILEAAKTKWNFVPFKPGLVGGHCISIDPHYLAFTAKLHGVHPALILAARKTNDDITKFIIDEMIKLLIKNKIDLKKASIGVFGISYKENTLDTRNSLSLKLIKELRNYGFNCLVHDPINHKKSIQDKHKITLEDFDSIRGLTVAMVLVAHDFYREVGIKTMLNKCSNPPIIMDIPNIYADEDKTYKDLNYWSL